MSESRWTGWHRVKRGAPWVRTVEGKSHDDALESLYMVTGGEGDHVVLRVHGMDGGEFLPQERKIAQ